jgi:hypothetical protein
MSLQKILGWIAIAVAIVGAFTNIPYAAAILVVLGLIGGYSVAAEDHVRVIVSALALTGLASLLAAIPQVGSYLQSIVTGLGAFAGGAALAIVLCNIYKRFKP